jgi:hypothetical protein
VSAGGVAERLRAEGLAPGSWSNGPGDRYGAHVHDYDKVIVVERGSIRFGLVDGGRSIAAIVRAAEGRHDAVVGPGVTSRRTARGVDAVAARRRGVVSSG